MKNLIIKCRYSIIALLMIILNGGAASAAAPWEVNPSNYRYDMSLYIDVAFAVGKMDYSEYDVAAFVGDECRGIAEVLTLEGGKECLYLRARSNRENGETMTFKYRNKATNEVLPIEAVSFDFVSNSRLGYPSTPHEVKIIFYHDVTISSTEGGSVSNTGGRLAEDTVLHINAIPAEGYHFTKWSDGNTDNPRAVFVENSDISLEAQFEVNIYKLTYNVDGAEYKAYEVAYNTTITAEANPTKEGYTFSGWDAVPETMPAKDVVVNGTFTINSYKAVFKIGEEVIDTKSIVYGEAITTPEAPVKEGYTFEGWKDVPENMPARDIEIVGSYKANIYKLTYNIDGAEYKAYEVAYNTTITAEAEPTKEGYTFSGWDAVPETMPAKDVVVSGTFTINSYKAVFKIGEEVIDTKSIVYGEAITSPEAPVKEGYTFEGWKDVPENMPARDIEIVGSYKVNIYKLTYNVDGAEYKAYNVAYNTTITAEANPTKEGYTFSGWDAVPETMPAKDVMVSGTFTINSYKAVFKIGEEVIDTKTIVYGEAITTPEAPVKEGYTFEGWKEVPENMPARDIEIVGSYKANIYKLTYNVDGAEYKAYDVAYNTTITAEANPTKEGYTFSGWDAVPETMPAKDVVVNGTFTINSYKAVFKIGEEVIDTKSIVYGEAITSPEAPVKEGYTFEGWKDVPENMPARDIEIVGSYKANIYKLTYNVDGAEYKAYEVAYNTTITAEAEPTKEGYTFSGWDAVPETMPAKDVVVSGTFTINSYKLTVYLDGDIYIEQKLEYGADINVPTPEIPEGKTFDGWDIEIPATMPAHDLEIHGTTSLATVLKAIFADSAQSLTIYTIKGQLVMKNATIEEAAMKLRPGIYIINGKKIAIK